MSQFLSWLFIPPLSEDSEQTRAARILYTILLVGIPVTFLFTWLNDNLVPTVPVWDDWLITGIGCLMLVSLVLTRLGYIRQATFLFLLNTLGGVTITSFSNLGIRNPVLFILPVLLMHSSVLLGSRASAFFAIITSCIISLLYFHEQYWGVYPQPELPTINYLLMLLILQVVTAVMLHFTINRIVQRDRQIRQQTTELHAQNQQLAEIREELEGRSQQLSQANQDLQMEMQERARTEAALRQKQKLESIGLLAGGVAHDFNNLLVGIMGQSELALRRLEDDSKVRPHLEKALQSAQRAADLTRQLLAYAGKARFQIEPVDLNQLIRANCSFLETVIQRSSRLYFQLQPDLPAVDSDPGQLQQVLMNLVINAAEAIPHDHGEIVITTSTVSLMPPLDSPAFVGEPPQPGEYVRLDVQDNGSGMDRTVLEKIFDPFFSTKERGHGLGLSVVLGVIQALHGGLQVQSQSQMGTTFSVYLLASQQAAAAEETLDLTAVQASSAFVLVIDDEESVRSAAAEMLNSVGYRTLVASNGAEGLALFHQRQAEICAILLDVVMPGLSGPETLEKIRSFNRSVHVILSSGYTAAALPDKLLQQPATTFLAKPYALEQLLKALAPAGSPAVNERVVVRSQ